MDLGEGYIALIDYAKPYDGVIALTHTEVPYEFENRGIGSELVKNCLNDIKGQGCKVIPSCSFVAAYIRRHPEWMDMVAR